MPLLNRYVAASADDVKYVDGGTAWSLVDVELTLGNFGGNNGNVPMIFQNITIPPGSTINTVTLTCTWNSTAAINIAYTHRCEAVDNSPAFTTLANFLLRAWTVASVNGAFVGAATADFPMVFAENLAPIVQEVINRPGWLSGNRLCICTFNNGSVTSTRFRSWDHAFDFPPEIDIDYTEPAVSSGRRRYNVHK